MTDSSDIYESPPAAYAPLRPKLRRPPGIWFFVGAALFGGTVTGTSWFVLAIWLGWADFIAVLDAGIVVRSGAGSLLLVAAAGLLWPRRWARPALVVAWALLIAIHSREFPGDFPRLTIIESAMLGLSLWYFYFRKSVRACYASLK